MLTIPAHIQKLAQFTDIHYGARDANKEHGPIHNQDCHDFVEFFCDEVTSDKDIDALGFWGDWNQNRSAINLETLKFAYEGAKKIDSLGLPVYCTLGNHDLYRRNSREIHSLHFFEQFKNFHLIEEPTVVENKGFKDFLVVPFLMHGEYADLVKFNKIPIWFGHFEFNGYEITGHGMEMTGGADPDNFQEPELIVSGHFHKRQAKPGKNIAYMGNPFPTSYGDSGDINRGYATYDFRNDEMIFFDWEAGPKYIKTVLSDIMDGKVVMDDMTYVKCIVDVPISYEESADIHREMVANFSPREFILEESIELTDIVTDTSVKDKKWAGDEMATLDEMVVEMFAEVDSEHISSDILVDIYQGLG